jgi:hypothetical protein
MALDLSLDYLVCDDPITVTYAAKTAENTWGTPVSVTGVQRDKVTQEDLTRDPALLQLDATVFHLWTANLGAVVPVKSGKVVYDSKTWMIRTVQQCDLDAVGVQRYRLICTRTP